ncbi:hypothetical protein ASG52_18540 [Methylobacterium sp. Leaf456]|uniref:hypothetical protein n=1 Tax=Methylobacterium sp. Leaf456 TaxID=1736382 RepID=UPI0006F748C4|nr:hypothetical protein [Methylobacterium sp. Leaf456]KQT60118.1 hypothetical protein ASG52_18540 [Methylobacterium sp. Leaf456]
MLARPCLSLFLAAFLVAAGGARAEEAPAWAVYDAPPFMIAEGEDREAGIFDRIRHLLDARLSGGPARTLRGPFPRVVSALKDGTEICFVGGIRTPEREAFAVFSLPVAMFYPLRIVVHAPERARFEARGPLSLPALLADRSLRTSFLRDRTQGPEIDALVRASGPPTVHSEFREAFRMLLADRLDYLVEYSAIAAYQANILGQPEGVAALPFAEAPAPLLSRVMCPNTEWGRARIARIDAILRAERSSPAYRAIVEAWAEPGDLATIREAYDRTFLTTE